MQQLLRRAFIPPTLEVVAIEEVVAAVAEEEEVGVLVAAGATGARTAEWITTPLLSAASSTA